MSRMADLERKLEERKLQVEIVGEEAQEAEKRALIATAKSKYGVGWRSILGVAKKLGSAETVQSLKAMGMGDKETMRDLSNPTKWGRTK